MKPAEEYEKLRKKYKNLPQWAWMQKSFPFAEEDGPVLLQLRKAISDKLEEVASQIEPIISGGEDYRSYFERRMLSAQEKEELFNLYKKLRSFTWELTKLSLQYSESDYCKFLESLKSRWEDIRVGLEKFSERLSEGWKEYKKESESTAYHG